MDLNANHAVVIHDQSKARVGCGTIVYTPYIDGFVAVDFQRMQTGDATISLRGNLDGVSIFHSHRLPY